MDVFKANVRIRSTAKALAILASHRREKYFVLENINTQRLLNLQQQPSTESREKSREKVEKRVGKSVKEKNLEKNENAGKKDRTGTKLQRRFKIESVI